MAIIKEQIIVIVGKNVEETEALYIDSGNIKSAASSKPVWKLLKQ